MQRREFLKLAACSALGTALASRAEAGEDAAPGRPNILFIMSDEHNATVLGANGNAIVRTPNLDGLAAAGVSFDACYCNSPLCVPSRASFLSGRYISRTGVWSNDCELPRADIPAVPNLLNAVGYQSYLCGKMHLAGDRRYGYTDTGGNFNNGIKSGHVSRRLAGNLPGKGLSDRFDAFHTGERSTILDHDEKVTRGTVEFLRNRKPGDKPFFLTVGYLAPHFPLIVPEKYWKAYEGRVPMPNIPPGYLEALPLNYKHMRAGFQMERVPPEVVKRGRELYYGLTQWLDEQIGQVLDALKETPFAENTVIVYTADHGENMGEHGLWWKNAMFDSATRIPLIVSFPPRWKGGQRRTAACSLVDVARTLVELGGGTVPADWDGDSMLPWLDRADAPWKDRAVVEYYSHPIASGYAMIRQGPYKYTYHSPADDTHPAERELYDLRTDPGELKNLAGAPALAAQVAELHAALLQALRESPDVTEQRCRADGARAQKAKGPGKKKAKGAKRKPAAAEEA
jgi:choline-sulfatase